MAVTVKKVTLWRVETANRPGTLAETLKPLTEAGTNLSVVMGYAFPGHPERAAIEVYPVTGRKAITAARSAGLSASDVPCLLVEGDNRAGLGHAIASRLAEAGINLSFLVAQVVGRRFSAVFGFESAADATQASRLIRAAAVSARRRR